MSETQGERGHPGERGQSGDSGQSGETGQPGQRGLTGETGQTGERGATGDHGQAGQMGDIGLTGMTGKDAPPVLSRAQTIFLFMFVVLCFALLAWRSEVNQKAIASNADKSCHRVNANTETINDFLDTLISNIESSAAYTPAEKEQRKAAYESSKRTLIDCN